MRLPDVLARPHRRVLDENVFPGLTTAIWRFVTSCREVDADQPAELSFISSDILLRIRGPEKHDPPFGAALSDGSWKGGFDHAKAFEDHHTEPFRPRISRRLETACSTARRPTLSALVLFHGTHTGSIQRRSPISITRTSASAYSAITSSTALWH